MPHSTPGILAPNVAEEVTIHDTWPHGITIINITGSATGVIWYRLDGEDPEPMAEDSFLCIDAVFIPNPAGAMTQQANQEPVKVKLVSTAALTYTVEGNPAWKRA